jgi:hypothetical protein
MGPHYANFVAIVDSLRSHDALRIAEKEDLASTSLNFFSNRAAAEAMGARAKEVFDRQAGATDRCVAAIRELLDSSSSRSVRHDSKSASRPLLWPLVPVYRLGLALRELQLRTGLKPIRRLRWPVVSIGNLSTGGAGKTPLTIALAKALTARGLHVGVLSRGYGRGAPRFHFWLTPAGQRRNSATNRSSSRAKLGSPSLSPPSDTRLACLPSAPRLQVFGLHHLLDDGFQHRQLARDVDILLLSRRDLSDHLLPAGNLREPLRAAERAQVIAIPADEPEVEAEIKPRLEGSGLARAPPHGSPAASRAQSPPFAASRGPISFFRGSNPRA